MEELKKEMAEIKEILLKLLKIHCRNYTIECKVPSEITKESLKSVFEKTDFKIE